MRLTMERGQSDSPSHNGSTGSGRSTPNSDSSPGKLFVGGLSWQTTPEKLKEYFSQFGAITDVLVMKDPVTQRSRGFGFITFSAPDSVERVLAVPNHTLDGKKIDPKHATPKSKSKANKTKKIFVGGVSQETSSDEVRAYFAQFGKVEEAVMLMDQQTKRHRGFGFVTFENEDVVDKVCEIHFHTIKNKKVECKKAQPKEAVQAANTAALLGKRVILNNLGIAAPGAQQVGLTMPGMQAGGAGAPGSLTQAMSPSVAAAFAAAQNQAIAFNSGFGKLMGGSGHHGHHGAGIPNLSSFRYAPYPMPTALTSSPAIQAALAAAQQQQQQPSHQSPYVPTTSFSGSVMTTAPMMTAGGHAPHFAAAATNAQSPNGASSQAPAHSVNGGGTPTSQSPAAVAATPTNHSALVAAAAAAAAQAAAQQGAAPGGQPGATNGAMSANPYQGYNLANVDMSSFQSVDWNSVYGMGMYV